MHTFKQFYKKNFLKEFGATFKLVQELLKYLLIVLTSLIAARKALS